MIYPAFLDNLDKLSLFSCFFGLDSFANVLITLSFFFNPSSWCFTFLWATNAFPPSIIPRLDFDSDATSAIRHLVHFKIFLFSYYSFFSYANQMGLSDPKDNFFSQILVFIYSKISSYSFYTSSLFILNPPPIKRVFLTRTTIFFPKSCF